MLEFVTTNLAMALTILYNDGYAPEAAELRKQSNVCLWFNLLNR